MSKQIVQKGLCIFRTSCLNGDAIARGEVLPNDFRHQYYKNGVSLNLHVLGSDLAGLVVQGVWSAYANKRIELVEPSELQA